MGETIPSSLLMISLPFRRRIYNDSASERDLWVLQIGREAGVRIPRLGHFVISNQKWTNQNLALLLHVDLLSKPVLPRGMLPV